MMDAELPDTADVFIPGGIVSDPPCLAQTWDNLYAKTLKSIRNPIGMPPLASFGGEDKTVVIVIPDILALPKTFTTAAVHLCMKDPSQNSTARDNAAANHPCGC